MIDFLFIILYNNIKSRFSKSRLDIIREMQKVNKLPFRYKKMGRWWGKTSVRRKDGIETAETEIDLLAVSEKLDKFIIISSRNRDLMIIWSKRL